MNEMFCEGKQHDVREQARTTKPHRKSDTLITGKSLGKAFQRYWPTMLYMCRLLDGNVSTILADFFNNVEHHDVIYWMAILDVPTTENVVQHLANIQSTKNLGPTIPNLGNQTFHLCWINKCSPVRSRQEVKVLATEFFFSQY